MRRSILSLKSPKLVVGNSFIMFDPGRLGIWELDEKPSVVSARRRIAAVAKRNELDKAEMSFMSSMVDALSLFSKDSAVFKDIKSPSLEPVGTYEAHWDLLQGTRLLSEILLENHRWKSIKTTDLSKYYPHSVRDQVSITYSSCLFSLKLTHSGVHDLHYNAKWHAGSRSPASVRSGSAGFIG
jgi:hypothetical protein